MGIYTIPYGVSFLDSLAEGVIKRADGDPLALANITLLLPTRRACRALRDSFLRISHGSPLLLPTISPIGDIASELLPTPAATLELPPMIQPLMQQLLLAKRVFADHAHRLDMAQALRLAQDLAAFLEEVHSYTVPLEAFETLVPEELATHWQHTLSFLRILSHQWPGMLQQLGVIDIADYRNRALRLQAESWRLNPPTAPIIAAGSVGNIPAVAELLGVIATLPQGMVVLPPVDQQMDEESWKKLDDCHPQAAVKSLLGRFKWQRQSIQIWGDHQSDSALATLISEMMRPAETSDGWQQCQLPEKALANLSAITASSLQEEATVIACIMRGVLQTPGKTAMLITNELTLARRVASQLEHWDIICNNSAGQPLSSVPAAIFIRLVSEMIDSRCSPLTLLAALKHPLAGGGINPAQFRHQVRELELAVLRGVRLASGVDGILASLKIKGFSKLYQWFENIASLIKPMMELTLLKQADFKSLLTHHLSLAEALASTDTETGASRLWAGDKGEQLADFIRQLLESTDDFGIIDTRSYSGMLEALFECAVYRPRYGSHPRLSILGSLEARLLSADLMILGELNEDSWPKAAMSDPWVNRPMRSQLGLPMPEQQIGLSAHDFSTYLAAPEVILIRSEKKEGTPTVPSRWWLRLITLLGEQKKELVPSLPWKKWARQLHSPEQVIAETPPMPRPPLSARPRKLAVTQIERWMRDPYSIYASSILQLRALEPIDADPGAAEFGTFIHKVLEEFINRYPDHGNLVDLLSCGKQVMEKDPISPAIKLLWWPRFERIADWFTAYEATRRPLQILTETTGKIVLDVNGKPFTITAKADRIDILEQNKLAIIDYKTGRPPSQRAVAKGFAPQLTLEALIAEMGGFEGLSAAIRYEIEGLYYMRLSGGEESGEELPVRSVTPELLEETKQGVERLIATFDDESTPYRHAPSPEYAPAYNDYAHLARVR